MMILQHSATMSWLVDGPLSACGARLWRSRRPGRLSVSAGRVWVTRSGDLDDHVLAAGQVLALGAHEDVVVEPWLDGSSACLSWRSDQPRPLVARAGGLLAALGRLALLGVRAAGLARVTASRWPALARKAAANDRRAHGSIAAGESRASCGAVQ